jgi:hypothetical protein
MTDADYTLWLSDPRYDNSRVWLFEINHPTETILTATQPYFNGSSLYDDWLKAPPIIDERLDGVAVLGEVEIYNPLTPAVWMGYQFSGVQVYAYIGDMSWQPADFRLIMDAKIESATYQGGNLFRFTLIERVSQILQNTKINDVTDGNGGITQMPVTIGEAYGVRPVLVDPVNHIYRVNSLGVSNVYFRCDGLLVQRHELIVG